METIYWIQRVGTLSDVFMVVLVLSILSTFVLAIVAITNYGNAHKWEDNKRWYNLSRHMLKYTIISLYISAIGTIFVPSEKELYVIYGVGGTIDYIKSNDTAKQLPDKVINALDAWIDKQTDK